LWHSKMECLPALEFVSERKNLFYCSLLHTLSSNTRFSCLVDWLYKYKCNWMQHLSTTIKLAKWEDYKITGETLNSDRLKMDTSYHKTLIWYSCTLSFSNFYELSAWLQSNTHKKKVSQILCHF
jgi:hypothetical protein